MAFRRASALAAADMMKSQWTMGRMRLVGHAVTRLPFCSSAHLQKFNAMSPQDKATTERHARTLRELVKRPDNKVCADCKHNGTAVFYTFACTLTLGP